jgi:AraC family transcriptional regulator
MPTAHELLADLPRVIWSPALAPTSYSLPAALVAGGRERITGRYDWPGAQRSGPVLLLQHTVGGRGRLAVAGAEHAVQTGDLMLLPLPHDHRYWLPPGGTWEHAWAIIHGAEVVRAGLAAIARRGYCFQPAADGPILRGLSGLLRGLAAEPTPDAYAVSGLVYAIAMGLLAETVHHVLADPDPGMSAAIALATSQAQAGRDPGVARLAATAGLSRWHFTRRFLECTGQSPGRFVLAARLRQAAARLAAGDSARDAGIAAGFDDPSYFGRVFRRAYGCPPGTFAARNHRLS